MELDKSGESGKCNKDDHFWRAWDAKHLVWYQCEGLYQNLIQFEQCSKAMIALRCPASIAPVRLSIILIIERTDKFKRWITLGESKKRHRKN